MTEPIDYLMAEDFEKRFGEDPWSSTEVGVHTHTADVIARYGEQGVLISITDEGMVMTGWRYVNITHRGACFQKVYDPETMEFLHDKRTS